MCSGKRAGKIFCYVLVFCLFVGWFVVVLFFEILAHLPKVLV